MFSSPVDEIRNRLNIVDIVGNYIKLQKAGANYRSVCPFHSDKKPSFFVSPARQIWHCFGCNLGGDIFKFIMQIENVEFGDALRILAQKAGVELKKQDPQLKTERNRLYDILSLATQFFEKQLEASKTGKEAKEYLLGRKISEESIKKWRLGYAPDTWQGLSDFLVGKGFKREEVEKAGLVIKNDQGHFYDRFRSRIMFPVFDLNSVVVGFGGRIFKKTKRPDGTDEAKYVNTPNTLLYDKSRILYGLDRAKVAIRRSNECVLVEGYTDVMLSHQAGVENVVAVSGTALTEYQLRNLKRYSENLIVCFDMDVAGDSANKRGIDLGIVAGFNVKVVVPPEGMDPADVISRDPEEWKKVIENKKSILEFYFENTFSRFDEKTIDGKKEISKILLPIIKRIPNKIEESHWTQKLAQKLDVKEADILEELKKVKLDNIAPISFEVTEEEEAKAEANPKNKTRKEMLEEKLASLVLKKSELLNGISEELEKTFSSEILGFFTEFRKYLSNTENKPEDFQKVIQEPLLSLVSLLAFRVEAEEDEKPEEEIKKCIKELKILELREKLEKISRDIKKAEEEKDLEKSRSLCDEFNTISQELLKNN